MRGSAGAGFAVAAGLATLGLGLCGCGREPPAPAVDERGVITRQIPGAGAVSRDAGYAPAAPAHPGAFDGLAAEVGRPASASLWLTRPLGERLHALLGEHFSEVTGALGGAPLAIEGSTYYVVRSTEGGLVALVIDARADALYVIAQDAGGRHEYSERAPPPALPPAVAALVARLPLG